VSDFPYHESYGLTDEVRLTVIETAKAVGCAHAARIHNVGVSTVYQWMRDLRKAKQGEKQ
jgi:transposase-like protein